MKLFKMSAIAFAVAQLSQGAYGLDWPKLPLGSGEARGAIHDNADVRTPALQIPDEFHIPENSETLSPADETFTLWALPTDKNKVIADEFGRDKQQTVDETLSLDQLVFRSGQSDLLEQSHADIDALLGQIEAKKIAKLRVIGHTDSQRLSAATRGRYRDNHGLSEARAEQVAKLFQQRLQLSDEQLSWVGYGDTRPLADNSTPEGMSKNRRVEVQVWFEKPKQVAIRTPSNGFTRTQVCNTQPLCRYHIPNQNTAASGALLDRLIDPINYDFGKHALPADAKLALREALAGLSAASGSYNVVIEGHTDDINIDPSGENARLKTNNTLSQRRGESVSEFLVTQLDVNPAAISIVAKGASEPLADNSTAAGRAKNRRVEVLIKQQVSQPVAGERVIVEQCGLDLHLREEVVRTQRREKLDLVVDPVRFASGSHIITDGYIAYLSEIVQRLSSEDTVSLRFVGHTDSDALYHTKAIYGDNQGLSEHRAREVMQFILPALGLDQRHGTYAGYGYSQPVAANDTEANKSLNRRVEVELWVDRVEEKTLRHEGVVEAVSTGSRPRDAFGLSPFRITVDGSPIEETEASHIADVERCVDVALEKVQLQLQPDNLSVKPALAVTAWPLALSQDDSETFEQENVIAFQAYSNYLTYIAKSEVRVFRKSAASGTTPLAIVPLDETLTAKWQFDENILSTDQASLFDDNDELTREDTDVLLYTVRVYNENGVFDETVPRELWLHDKLDTPLSKLNKDRALLAAYGENMLARQRIPLDGGTVKVNGINVPEDHNVYVMGRLIPVGDNNKFVTEQIIPEGYHTIEIALLDGSGNGELFHRDLALPESDWFVVGLADVTLGLRDTNGPASTVTQDSSYDDDAFATGRLAFFAEGKTASNVKITASADTREQPLEDLFSNFTNKDPSVLFRRLDDDLYYPTFGDDSTIEEGAPTQGRFYVKAEKNGDHLMWGNFDASVAESELTRVDRGLYGAQLKYGSDERVKNGDEKYQLELFAAEPGTIGAREEFRGTGGSVFFTKHLDLTTGSENVYIETRDLQTGRILGRERLTVGRDYDIDYIQGRVLLERPLSSFSQDNAVISANSLSGNPNFLVVTYEYTPGFTELDDVALGGRASTWLTDSMEMGVTALDQEQLGVDQSVLGVDLKFEDAKGNQIKLEVAQSKGLAINQLESLDGGFDFTETGQVADPNIKANAYRLEAVASYDNGISLNSYIQNREAGYSASGQVVDTDTNEAGVRADIKLTAKTELGLEIEIRDEEVGQTDEQYDIELSHDFKEKWQAQIALRRDEITNNDPRLQNVEDVGARDEVGISVGYDSDNDWSLYGFGQYTVSADSTRDRNDRLGLGGSYKITDNLQTDAELSGGTSGVGAQVGLDYQSSEYTNYYFTLANENQRSTSGLKSLRGNATAGFKNKYSERLNVYGEERYAYGDQPKGLTHAYGVDFSANEYWNYGGGMELGTLRNEDGSDTDRLALNLTAGYSEIKSSYAGALEYRTDKTTSSDRKTWLMRHSYDYQTSEDWRLIAGLDWSLSQSSQGEFFDGDFTEAVLGYAYRPVDNEKWNTLVKYTYFFNKPAPEQVNTNNANSEFIQRSQIVSVDMTYQFDPRWTFGGKYAFKKGELALDRVNPQYFTADTQLLVLRADWHVVNDWDFLIEGRILDAITAQDTRSGFLTAIYRHINNNIKIGVGYNFTDFSDDLTDLSFDEQGIFINVIGKM